MVVVAVGAAHLDLSQDQPQDVARGQEHAGGLRRDRQGPVSDTRQEALRRMSDPFELEEAQEPAGALDRVHGAEDAREHVTGSGVSFECEEVAVQPVEALVALDEELRNDLVHLARHVRSPLPRFEGPRAEHARRPEPLEQRLLSDFRPRSKGSLDGRAGVGDAACRSREGPRILGEPQTAGALPSAQSRSGYLPRQRT